MQQWEYTAILRNRDAVRGPTKEQLVAGDWVPTWPAMERQLQQLGDEGWELVTVITRSGLAGGYNNAPVALDFAGFTDQEAWVFKRPKP